MRNIKSLTIRKQKWIISTTNYPFNEMIGIYAPL